MNIDQAYDELQRVHRTAAVFDRREVVKCVEEYRRYWKPEKPRVILLAESHVLTTPKDYAVRLKPIHGLKGYPTNYVRFVYCLGYGENDLLERPIEDNSGTVQYWKLLYSCLHNVRSHADFGPVVKRHTISFEDRFRNKINLLNELKRDGVWLLDASVVAIYPKDAFTREMQKSLVRASFQHYIKPQLDAMPDGKVVVIGKQVLRAIDPDGINGYDWVYQPQGCRAGKSSELDNYRKLNRLVNV